MTDATRLAEVAALVGDPARANILCALLDGRAFTATELSFAAGVTAQTTSGHLAKLAAASLILHKKEGRHCYYRIAGSPIPARSPCPLAPAPSAGNSGATQPNAP